MSNSCGNLTASEAVTGAVIEGHHRTKRSDDRRLSFGRVASRWLAMTHPFLALILPNATLLGSKIVTVVP